MANSLKKNKWVAHVYNEVAKLIPLQLPLRLLQHPNCQVRDLPWKKKMQWAKQGEGAVRKRIGIRGRSLQTLVWFTFSNDFKTSRTRDSISLLERPAAAEYDARWRAKVYLALASCALLNGALTAWGRATERTATRRKDICGSQNTDLFLFFCGFAIDSISHSTRPVILPQVTWL